MISPSQALFLFAEGILAFVSPCFLPLLPIYLLYLTGDEPLNRRGLVLRSIGFIGGFSLLYLLLGATATQLGQLLHSHRQELQRGCGLILILLTLHALVPLLPLSSLQQVHSLMAHAIQKRIPRSLHLQDLQQRISQSPSILCRSFLFGIVLCGSWTPCLLPFIGSALMLSAQAQTLWIGVLLMAFFCLGMGLPFLLLSLLIGKLQSQLQFLKRHSNPIRFVSLFLLLILGALMLFDALPNVFQVLPNP